MAGGIMVSTGVYGDSEKSKLKRRISDLESENAGLREDIANVIAIIKTADANMLVDQLIDVLVKHDNGDLRLWKS